ncbi:MAG: stage III sporulation protein AF [Lachnospiraceae bacterium]|nr:stage III sporulation protein AF [Lachnospiraceae bacterium]
MSVWMEYLKRICCFLLIAETMEKLCPSSKYEAYLHMITGLICLAMILIPLTGLLHMDQADGLPDIHTFEKQLQQIVEEGQMQMERELSKKWEGQIPDEADISDIFE